eukprot:3228638-Prymnesium_polylepis.3
MDHAQRFQSQHAGLQRVNIARQAVPFHGAVVVCILRKHAGAIRWDVTEWMEGTGSVQLESL